MATKPILILLFLFVQALPLFAQAAAPASVNQTAPLPPNSSFSTWLPLVAQRLSPPTPTPMPIPTLAPTPTPVPGPLQVVVLSGDTTPEYAVVLNTGSHTQNMTGWRLFSAVGSEAFYFPLNFKLAPGQSVRIESGSGALGVPPASLFWSSDPVWRDSGDRALLYSITGHAVHSRCYGDAC